MSRSLAAHLRRRQLDEQLGSPALRLLKRPPRGWIREVRLALGMSAAQLARRMGVSQPTVAKLERAEADDAITLRSLKRAAEAMDCELVYAFVPRGSLEEMLRAQARRRASELTGRVEHTMTLEAQGQGRRAADAGAEELAGEMVRTMSRDIWGEGA